MKALCDQAPSGLRLATLARCARELGARTLAVGALQRLLEAMNERGTADLSEPFIVPEAHYEAVAPRASTVAKWCFCAAMEALEQLGHYSLFYSGTASEPRLAAIAELGFGSEEMARRLWQLRQRYGLAPREAIHCPT
jgi:hypothetical protein